MQQNHNPSFPRRDLLDPEVRRHLGQRLMAASVRILDQVRSHPPVLSGATLDDLSYRLEPTEASFLLMSLFALMMRDASAADCALYAAHGLQDLPFCGSEQAMLDTLLRTLDERLGAPNPAHLVADVATAMEDILRVVERESGISRPVLARLIGLETSRV